MFVRDHPNKIVEGKSYPQTANVFIAPEFLLRVGSILYQAK